MSVHLCFFCILNSTLIWNMNKFCLHISILCPKFLKILSSLKALFSCKKSSKLLLDICPEENKKGSKKKEYQNVPWFVMNILEWQDVLGFINSLDLLWGQNLNIMWQEYNENFLDPNLDKPLQNLTPIAWVKASKLPSNYNTTQYFDWYCSSI